MVKSKRYESVEGLCADHIQEHLAYLILMAKDACDLEDVLLNTIKSTYKSLPDGKRLYGGEHSLPIKLERFSEKGFVYVECVVSELEPDPIAIEEGAIATIYLRNMTYSMSCNWLPIDMTNRQRLIEDTEKVMKYLGLRKAKARNI
jgi:hypothetical protein